MVGAHVVTDFVDVGEVRQAVRVHNGIAVAIEGRCRGLHGEPGEMCASWQEGRGGGVG